MFAAFSVLGNGGEASARVFSINSTGGEDYQANGSILSAFRGTNLSRYRTNWETLHAGMSDDANGDILHEIKIEPNAQVSRVNNADEATRTSNISGLSAEEFNIGDATTSSSTSNAAIDLEYLALFPASITDDQADSVRSYINKRGIYLRHDTDGYYFFDPQKADFTGNFTGANTLDGYITGSDNGDTDVRSNLTLEQSTLNDQPTTDGYTITFNDSAEHLEFENSASQNLSGWQICGTSLGTFAYRVQGAVAELNLLGNFGYLRKAGDSYGVILLPESASAADIEQSRSLLIDRGAADGLTASNLSSFWRNRFDITEFKPINCDNSEVLSSTWRNMQNMVNFPISGSLLSSCVSIGSAFRDCHSMLSVPPLSLPLCTAFNGAFNDCRGLTSFPLFLDISRGRSFNGTWGNCLNLADFPANFFNDWTPSSILSGVFHNTWVSNLALTAVSVGNILQSIDESGQHATDDGTSGGTALDNAGIDIDYNVATGSLSAATTAAVTSLKAKGWSIVVNNVTL